MKLLLILLIPIQILFKSEAEANLAYITNEKDNTVSIIDIKKKKVVKTVNVGQRPRGIIMSKDGKLVLICALILFQLVLLLWTPLICLAFT